LISVISPEKWLRALVFMTSFSVFRFDFGLNPGNFTASAGAPSAG
jgi:hypothetical protein